MFSVAREVEEVFCCHVVKLTQVLNVKTEVVTITTYFIDPAKNLS